MKQLRLMLLFALVALKPGFAQNQRSISPPAVDSQTATARLVDANNAPSADASATVQSKVPSQYPTRSIAGAAPAAPIPPELRNAGDINLPLAGSPLPLLSVVGFGLLIAGAAHTIRASKNSHCRAAH
ncbi:MAG: hypothetical protein ABSD13_14395 [Candidatus Korobacteraceae bacterium]|jgi:hypothetical protein